MKKKDILCKLTGRVGPGVKAHIIPRSFYDFGTDGHQPCSIIFADGTSVRRTRSQVGEYDEEIVTEEGESYFLDGDTYAYETLIRRGQEGKLYHDGRSPLCVEIAEYDYRRLKMFFITLLWRAGVSSRRLFRNVRLGPHEERLRKHILAGDPGGPEDYSVIVGFHEDTPDYGFPMLEPTSLRDDETKIRYYRFSLGRLVACIKVDKQCYGNSWEDFVLSESLPLRFIVLDSFKKTSLYKSLGRTVKSLHDNR